MKLWTASLNQMAFLVLLILIGYLLVRLGTVEANAGKILSKLETHLFTPPRWAFCRAGPALPFTPIRRASSA